MRRAPRDRRLTRSEELCPTVVIEHRDWLCDRRYRRLMHAVLLTMANFGADGVELYLVCEPHDACCRIECHRCTASRIEHALADDGVAAEVTA